MDFKSYFKPNKSKLLISSLLVVISYLIVFVLFRYYFIYSNPVTLLFYNIPIYFTLLVFVLLSYPFACYMSENNAWLKGILFFLAAFVLTSIVLLSAVTGYNNTVGLSCSADSDCHYDLSTCQPVNNKHISLRDPFLKINCIFGSAICENKKCETFDYKDAKFSKDCERLAKDSSLCYYSLAEKLNDASLCDKIEEIDFKEACKKKVEESISGYYNTAGLSCQTNSDCKYLNTKSNQLPARFGFCLNNTCVLSCFRDEYVGYCM